MITAKNPILSGFYPDPSICAVGDDYYLVTSTFAYFPGVPVFHSRDLANWEQLGHVLDRRSQLPLAGCGHSEGIFAPTIRYHEGTFYMITTNISGGGNFLVTAKDPAGPWSEPYWLDAPGIDPSLFFDDDGSCWYVGNRSNPAGMRYNGDCQIWLQRFDLGSMKLTGEIYLLWTGAMRDAVWPEGPHLYKKDGYYYLMTAEGGTGTNHCVMVARSRSLTGPYEGNPRNPILTHRHLGRHYPVQCVGHADLVRAQEGSWYLVMLATRPQEGYTAMGRETFLAKVAWEDGWPVVNPGVGRLEDEVVFPGLPTGGAPHPDVWYFREKTLPPEFVTLRNPAEGMYSLRAGQGGLSLSLLPGRLAERTSPAYLAVRQRHHEFQAAAQFFFTPGEQEEAGLAIVQSNECHLRFVKRRQGGGAVAEVIVCEGGRERVLARRPLADGETVFELAVRGLSCDCICRGADGACTVAKAVDMRPFTLERAGGFAGCTVGMYASSNGRESRNTCEFSWFSYQELS